MEWTKRKYNEQYEIWMPWIEDQYLKWFGKDNKASYMAKDQLSRTKVSGVEQVDTLQDSLHNTVAAQIGKGGLGEGPGNLVSKEGINRAERSGKDEKGGYVPGPLGERRGDPAVKKVREGGEGAVDGTKRVGGWVRSWIGGKKTGPQEGT